MSDESNDSNILLEKMEKWLQRKFPYLFLDFNEYGTNAVLLLEYMKSTKQLFGKYSEMTPLMDQTLEAIESAVLSTGSIGGKTVSRFLTKKLVLAQSQNFGAPQQKESFFGGFGGMGGGNKQQGSGLEAFGGR